MTGTITYAALVARAETCLAISAGRAAVADYGRAAKFRFYAESLIDALEIDRRGRGESWDVGGRETLEGRLRRVKAAIGEGEAEPVNAQRAARLSSAEREPKPCSSSRSRH